MNNVERHLCTVDVARRARSAGGARSARRPAPRRAAQRSVAARQCSRSRCSPATSGRRLRRQRDRHRRRRADARRRRRKSRRAPTACAAFRARRSASPSRRATTGSRVRMDFSPKNADLEVRVPRRTSVHASLVNGGDIEITGVTGEHELSNVNGDVDRDGHLGLGRHERDERRRACDVPAVDGDQVRCRSRRSTATSTSRCPRISRPTCSSRASRATCSRISTSRRSRIRRVVERSGDAGGRYHVRMQQQTRYAIGGGGPDIQLRTFNGDVMIRKR